MALFFCVCAGASAPYYRASGARACPGPPRTLGAARPAREKKKRDARKGIAHEPAWSADE
ncbi:hypothetical protein C6T59_17790 [Burkholderia multivorans]|nr:hypothetical protein C6Q01_17095 [Burkholderia multivorans]PRF89644.1 hypothetical protein C6Q23_14390 [Burkholderia multivorans]PRG65528.1 hypothetical protein C6T59_17790 [Burkholderia multivorans]